MVGKLIRKTRTKQQEQQEIYWGAAASSRATNPLGNPENKLTAFPKIELSPIVARTLTVVYPVQRISVVPNV